MECLLGNREGAAIHPPHINRFPSQISCLMQINVNLLAFMLAFSTSIHWFRTFAASSARKGNEMYNWVLSLVPSLGILQLPESTHSLFLLGQGHIVTWQGMSPDCARLWGSVYWRVRSHLQLPCGLFLSLLRSLTVSPAHPTPTPVLFSPVTLILLSPAPCMVSLSYHLWLIRLMECGIISVISSQVSLWWQRDFGTSCIGSCGGIEGVCVQVSTCMDTYPSLPPPTLPKNIIMRRDCIGYSANYSNQKLLLSENMSYSDTERYFILICDSESHLDI